MNECLCMSVGEYIFVYMFEICMNYVSVNAASCTAYTGLSLQPLYTEFSLSVNYGRRTCNGVSLPVGGLN